ncbi:MBL fold metallo-hydrolase, partial [Streptomyces sp. SB3404]|nr:MBL fold metallo-hydrolase [Streptomyces boncukensis]
MTPGPRAAGLGGVRPAVHAAAPHPLGSADPRGEGPPDLRLIPPALAAWAAAALALGASGAGAAAGIALCLLTAVLLLVAAVRGGIRQRPRPAPGARGPGGAPGPGRSRRALLLGAAVSLLCAAAGATGAALHAADLRRGPLPQQAERYARTTAEVTVTGDPRLTRPEVRGARRSAGVVVIPAEAVRTDTPDGGSAEVRTPVLLLVTDTGDRRSAWLRLLPSTRLRVAARLAPPSRAGPG